MSDTGMTYEELQTIAIEAEAILNSWPIAGHSEDPNDGEAFTPGHLLTGSSLKTFPEPAVDDSKYYYHTFSTHCK